MKDAVKKFEEMYQMTESWFDNFHNKMKNTIKPKYSQNQNVQQLLKKHGKDLESGDECKGLSKGPNNLFFSTVGSSEALFGKNRNKVEDMGDLKISKRELRCYDLTKDKFGIAWLFDNNAKFTAKKIWGQPGDIHFEGIWESGIFKGAWHGPQENFKTSSQNYQGTGWNPNAQSGHHQNNTQPIEFKLYNEVSREYATKTLTDIIEMYARGLINKHSTQVFYNNKWIYFFQLPEFNEIESAAQRLIAGGPPPAP